MFGVSCVCCLFVVCWLVGLLVCLMFVVFVVCLLVGWLVCWLVG